MYQDAQIKKNPDTYQKQEEDRMARLERLQKQYDEVNLEFCKTKVDIFSLFK